MFGLEILHQETGPFSFYKKFNILLVCFTNVLYIYLPPNLLICIQNPMILCWKELPNTTTFLS